MLQNNLDPDVARDPDNLIVYGGTGRAVRNWDCFDATLKVLENLEEDETLLMQSGKPVGVFKTHKFAPRVLITNSLIVPHWATWEYFRELVGKGLTVYGQMTAGSWIYIGTQGILQGTYKTLAAIADKYFGGTLKGKLVVTGGLGEMSGAQPLAIVMNEGVGLIVEVDETQVDRKIEQNYLMEKATSLDQALKRVNEALEQKTTLSIGLVANCADILPELVKRNITPDIVTDQTSAHDALNGYVPNGMTFEEALKLRKSNPDEYIKRSMEAMRVHCEAMVTLQERGAIVFDYGNNLRQMAYDAGLKTAFSYPGFIPAYIRPLFCEGSGPFRYAALSGNPEDIYKLDDRFMKEFEEKTSLVRWLKLAKKHVRFQGLPARIFWLNYGERLRAALIMNEMVHDGELDAPLVIGRDHLDCGSVASPNRETESMKDGSDAIADWPILNALINTAAGATWVSVHQGGGVGIPYAIHAGQVTCVDGTQDTEERLRRVMTTDPGMGVIRHADAGYEKAIEWAKKKGIRIPMLE